MNPPANHANASTVATAEKRLVDWQVFKDEKTHEHSFIRFKFARILAPEVLSQNQPPRVVEFFRGDGEAKISVGWVILTNLKIKRGLWAKARCVGPAETLHRCSKLSEPILNEVRELTRGKTVLCEVIVGRGERIVENIEEVFLFAYMPPDVASFQNEHERLKRWAGLVLQWVDGEEQANLKKLKAEGNARTKEQLKKFPRDGPKEIDHYKNWSEVMLKLLRTDWPHFFVAIDSLEQATTEAERADRRRRIVIGYCADYKALYGSIPKLKQEEAAELSRDDDYIRLMNEAREAPKGCVPKIHWQLHSGWIEKNYYRMNEKQLEKAFAQDWNHKPGQHKGNTLACLARRTLGLKFASKPGRPEKPNLLPPG